jgi:hypothetical protein
MFPLKILHHYNSGDLISILAGLQAFHKETGRKTIIYQFLNLPAFYYDGTNHPTKHDGYQVCMNQEIFDMMKPLLLEQEYIEGFEVYKGEAVDLDFQITRDRKYIPMPYGDIYHWSWTVFPQLACDLSEKWLGIHKKMDALDIYLNKIVVNFTERYRNPYITYYFLRQYQKNIIFLGNIEEHKKFCEQWDLKITHVTVENFVELAHLIDNCKFFLGNQSFCFHVANAMKMPRILEVCSQFPNTLPNGKDGYSFIYQDALTFYFDKLNS